MEYRLRLVALGSLLASGALADACHVDQAISTVTDPAPLIADGYGARWSRSNGMISFMRQDEHGYFRSWLRRENGEDERLLGRTVGPLPGKHQSAGYWHPSGEYLLLIAQKPEWSGRKLFGVPDYEAIPGFGRHDDMWLVRTDGTAAWQLTHDANTRNQGILIPVFSPDGARVAWSARQDDGRYVIQVADFVVAPKPHLEHIRSFEPGGKAYYETGSFSSDSRFLAYASDQDTHSFWRSQLYILDVTSGSSTRLTQGRDYNEHPTIVGSQSGDWVIYMSTRGVDRRPLHLMLGTDWYAMRIDGSGLKRLTTMNSNHDASGENSGELQVGGTVAIAPSGEYFLGDVQNSLTRQSGFVRTFRFRCR